jgi:signal transduction histidine kinase/ActR/RegA family two-component response regulator
MLYEKNSACFDDIITRVALKDRKESLRWSVKPMEDDGDHPAAVLCAGVRITDMIESESALRASQEQFTSFMNNLPAYAYVKDAKGEHHYSNAAVKALLHTRKERTFTSDFVKDEEGLQLIREANARLIAGETEVENIEYEGIMGDDNLEQRIRETIFPIHMASGEIRLGGIAFDISENYAIEEQLNQARKMQAIGELAGGIAHDFNNQLSGIMGYADLLVQGIDDPRKERYSRKLVEGIERASETTKQLLNFSRKGSKESHSIKLNEVIDDIINLLSHSMEKTVKIHFDQKTEDDLIQGDPNQIQNALLNIAINGRDAMQGMGELYFTTRKIKADDKMVALQGYAIKKGYYLKVSVEDTGSGMNRETQNKIFEPFFTTKGKGEGTGMGLAMVYSTLKDHDGNVTVQSTPGKGTVFNLYFPCSGEEPASDAEKQEAGEVGEAGTNTVPYNIAIVDDESMIRDFLSLSLREKGHRVALFEGGRQAVTAFKDSHVNFDLVILDMIMPGMDGPETYRELMKVRPELPVLLSSGYSRKEDLLELIKKPRVLYLQKPYSINDLYEAIDKLMDECAGQDNP